MWQLTMPEIFNSQLYFLPDSTKKPVNSSVFPEGSCCVAVSTAYIALVLHESYPLNEQEALVHLEHCLYSPVFFGIFIAECFAKFKKMKLSGSFMLVFI